MESYLNLLALVLKQGTLTQNRTKYAAITYFGTQSRYDLTQGFPLVTTKKMAYKAIFTELLWFLKGDTNIKYLVDHNVRIWNEWPYEKYKQSSFYQNESQAEFITKIQNDPDFAQKHGDLGPVYGRQWRCFNGVDQIQKVITAIRQSPHSRRLIVSAWNPAEIDQMLLPPCHCLFQFFVSDQKELSLQLYQRSADLFLGVPFNIASYSLLTHLVALACGLKAKEFIHTIGNAHIYENHIPQVQTQLQRKPYPLPQLVINNPRTDLCSYEPSDFSLINYVHHPLLKGEVAV